MGPEEKQMLMMFTEDCRKEYKVTDEEMDELIEGKIPENHGVKCVITCTMKQFHVVKEHREIPILKIYSE